MNWAYAAGGLYSTVEDLLRWGRALETEALLTDASKTAMWTPVKDTYGYGWTLRAPSKETLGRRVRMHGGLIQGFSGCFVGFPDEDLTAIVLSNNVLADACSVAMDLAAIALDEDYTIPVARRAIRADAELLDRYIGEYRFDGGLVVTIAREGDELVARTSRSDEPLKLFAESETDFFLKTADVQVTFTADRRGVTNALVVHFQNRNERAARIGD